VQLLALGQRQLDLDPPVLQIHTRGHEREARSHRLALELADLSRVQQQLALA
jgi:hypothetical protein